MNISWFRDISEYFEKYVLVHGYPEYAEEYLLYPRENAQSDKMIELEWHKIIIKKKEKRGDLNNFQPVTWNLIICQSRFNIQKFKSIILGVGLYASQGRSKGHF